MNALLHPSHMDEMPAVRSRLAHAETAGRIMHPAEGQCLAVRTSSVEGMSGEFEKTAELETI